MKASQNPYRPPPRQDAASDVRRETPAWAIPLGELVVVAAVIGLLVGLLLPAVSCARDVNPAAPSLPSYFEWLNQSGIAFTLTTTIVLPLVIFLAAWLLRLLAPAWLRPYIPWWKLHLVPPHADEPPRTPEVK